MTYLHKTYKAFASSVNCETVTTFRFVEIHIFTYFALVFSRKADFVFVSLILSSKLFSLLVFTLSLSIDASN